MQLNFTLTYHPQSNGQTEVANKTFESYLRCFVGTQPRNWSKWLPMTQCCYNFSYHLSTKTTPFEALFVYPPLRFIHYVTGTTDNQTVEDHNRDQTIILQTLKSNLQVAQDRQKTQADQKRKELTFRVGECVFLKL